MALLATLYVHIAAPAAHGQTDPWAAFDGDDPALLRGSAVAYVTGNRLLEGCTSADPDAQGICLGYVIGTVDTLTIPCLPAHVTAKQLQDIVTAYLREHPATRHQPASFLVASAVFATFPCGPEGSRNGGGVRHGPG